MRSAINYLLTFMLLFSSGLSYAQQGTTITDKRGGHWFIGLDGGIAWQNSDVKSRSGGGWGFNIGKNIFYKETSPISLDLRGRYMGTWTHGLSPESTLISSMDSSYLNSAPVFKQYDSTSYIFHNHRTEFHDIALELRLNFEGLRRKTNIHLGLFAGIGLGFYNARFEQLGITDSPYNYESIDQNQTPSNICRDIIDLWPANRDYESAANIDSDFEVALTPSIGLELGYWFSPGFMMGIGHRTTFTFQDDFEGVWGGGSLGSVHHYSHLFFHWNIYGKGKKTSIDVECPDINFNFPSSNNGSYTTDEQTVVVRATVKNIDRNQLTFNINGNSVQSYSLSNTDFEAAVTLQAGTNIISIKGNNDCGVNAQNITVVYNPKQQPQQAPIVTITNPASTPTTVNTETVNINATIQYVASSTDVTFTVNGQNSRNFTFTGTSFRANNVNLNRGSNVITITGSNNVGSDSKSVIINYQRAKQPPIVDITFPSNSPYNSNQSNINIAAKIQYVASSTDVTFTVNGQNSRSFTLNGTSFIANNINLNEGSNVVVVTGTNDDGTDAETVIINYKEKAKPAPVVTITTPSQNPLNTNMNNVNIAATIQHVSSSNDVTFTINGQTVRNFTFNGTSFSANNINLNQGSNTFTITGRNTEGSDTKSTVVIYSKPEPAPVVTITSPNQNPYTSPNQDVNISATILNVSNANDVTFNVNGMNSQNFNFSGTNFSATNVGLRTGSNSVTITGRNSVGQDIASTIIIYQPAPKPAPIVTITYPNQNPFNTSQNSININANILNVAGSNDVSFSVNGQNLSSFNFSGTNFTANNIRLKPGSNTFTITGRNTEGSDTKSTVVVYTEDVPEPPVVNITNPSANPYTVSTNTASINATILNVDNRNNVTFNINGQTSQNFSFNGSSFVANNVNLNQGSNTIVITGSNRDGQDSKSTVIIYNKAVEPPVVNITSPRTNPYNVSSNVANINATVLNVASKNNVTFTINGQSSQNFSFNGTSFVANNVNLNQGSNTFTITGSNNAGQDTKSTVIIYTKAVEPPVVNITSPRANPYNVSTNTANVNATILNVDNRNNVVFNINGQTSQNFSFNGTSFVANNVNLNSGSNTLVITGKNTAGQDTKSTIIIYTKPVEPPVVRITNPRANPYTMQNNVATVTASITNVANQSNVTFMVNGQSNSSFSLVGTNFVANGISLNTGSNTFSITGKNSAGQDTKSTIIIYQPVPKPKPLVTITNPAANPFTTAQNSSNINATILNVASSNNVTFTVNGQSNRNFTFNGTSFSANNITLNAGSNTFTITGTNPEGTDSKSTVIIYNKPTPKPTVVITAPNVNPFNTTQANTNISATITNVANSSGVTFTVNGQVNTGFSFSGTNFTANNIALNAGANTFTVTGRNSNGQDSKSTVVIYNKPTPKPTVVITAPNVNPFNTTQANTNISATITNVANSSGVTFTVNGQVNTSFSFSGTSFSANNVALNQGANTFTVTGRNSNGQDSKSTVVIYSPQVAPPTVTITNPKPSPFNTQTNSTNITATITNVANNTGITFTVNGVNTRSFSFNGTSFTANNVALNVGNNIFTISGRNSAGQDTRSVTVIYTQATPKPTVTITSPSANPHNQQVNKVNITASITNVANANDVTFMVNGIANRTFNFSGTAFNASNVSLNNGQNTLTITGRNSAGQDSKSTVVVYNLPTPKPVVTITNPTTNPFNTANARLTINATILNVASSNDITFTQNGQAARNFSFAGKVFTAAVQLIQGNNTFVITGRNSAGQDTKSTVVIYSPAPKLEEPVVTITTPARNPATVTTVTTTIKATILNVSSAADVTFTLNGQVNSNFSFRGTAFTANNVNLNQGNNTVTITGRNASGQASKSTVIVYNKPIPKPVVNYTNPTQNPMNTQSSSLNIAASVQHVPTASGITFTHNGQKITNFTYANGSFLVRGITLSAGANTFVITGTNNSGQDSKTTVINYSAPQPSPVVTYTNPTQNPMNTQSSRLNIAASVQHVPTASGITFTHNGQRITNFTYANGSFLVRGITLAAGANTFVITGTNNSGQDSKTTVINYTSNTGGGNGGTTGGGGSAAASLPPIVMFTAPAQNTVSTSVVTVTANVSNMVSNDLSQFEITINGARQTNFTFNGTTVTIPNVRLNAGNNSITIKATNSKGVDTKTKTITFTQAGNTPINNDRGGRGGEEKSIDK